MNKNLFIAIAFIGVIAAGVLSIMPDANKPVTLNDKAIPFTLPNLQGQAHGLPEGKVVILNFWATWCPPCRKEVPSMVELYNKLKDKGLDIVAVSVDRNPEDLMQFVAEQRMNFTILHDIDSVVAHKYSVFRYPESFIIDRNGVIRQHLQGAVEWMDPEFAGYIEKLLQEPVAK